MKSLRHLFLCMLFLFLVISQVEAAPKRCVSGEIKNGRLELTTGRQEAEYQECEERTELSLVEEGREVDSQSKRARNETDSEASQEAVEATSITPARFLRTQEIPTLYRCLLERLMKLKPRHPVFNQGLPLAVENELVDPYMTNIKAMLNDIHQACWKYGFYRLSPGLKNENLWLNLKKLLQEHQKTCELTLSDSIHKNYPHALFLIESMRRVFPLFQAAIEDLKLRETYKKKVKLPQNRSWVALLNSIISSLSGRAVSLVNTATESIKLQDKLRQERPHAEIEVAEKSVMHYEQQSSRIQSILDQQKIFLDQWDQLGAEQKIKLMLSFQAAFKVLDDLNKASLSDDQEMIYLLEEQERAYDQIIKSLLSTNSQVLQMQRSIIKVNENLAIISSEMISFKLEQRKVDYIRKEHKITRPNGQIVVYGEEFNPIFELYYIPLSFFDREIALLQSAKNDLLSGREEACARKRILAHQWDLFNKSEIVNSLNLYVQISLIPTPEELLRSHQERINDLKNREIELEAQALTYRLSRDITSISWDFKKSFEENVAALP